MADFVKNTALARKLAHLGIHTVEDLLYYFPYRYDDFTHVVAIRDLDADDVVAIEGTIRDIKAVRAWKTRMQLLEAVVEDGTGMVRVVWFNQLYLLKTLKKGTAIAVAGKVYESKRGIYFANPAYEALGAPNSKLQISNSKNLHTRRLVPVYRETKGITSRFIRTLVHHSLPAAGRLPDVMPEDIREREHFLQLAPALAAAHFPSTPQEATEVKRRFQFEELLLLQLRFSLDRRGRERAGAHAIPFNQTLIKSFVDALPFTLTDGQRKAAWHILQDIAKPYPMQRLLEGDVGSGKTIVAFLAILETIKTGYQATVMAPTEVLARQHFQNAKKIFAPHRITVGFATSSAHAVSTMHIGEVLEKKVTKKTFYALLKTGDIQLAIGTHALISPGVVWRDLALAIVDEQHRFGVQQRALLANRGQKQKETDGRGLDADSSGQARGRTQKFQQLSTSGLQQSASSLRPSAATPHFLSMSATPIPRTLALAVYGDLDISRIDELPRGRQSIETRIVLPQKRNEAYAFMRAEIQKGRQAFVICPRIESIAENTIYDLRLTMYGDKRKSAWSDVKTVKEEYKKLSTVIFPDLRIAMLHGKMKPKEKEAVMKKFSDREFDILVSTSVIEVGIDIPNASVMAIEGADRFGLSQLHQFRGRVGRGEHQSYCLLLSDSAGAQANARLKALLRAKTGFELAQIDLELRGPGQFMGSEQAGLPDIAMEALRHPQLIETAREDAKRIFAASPDLTRYAALKAKVQNLGEKVHGE